MPEYVPGCVQLASMLLMKEAGIGATGTCGTSSCSDRGLYILAAQDFSWKAYHAVPAVTAEVSVSSTVDLIVNGEPHSAAAIHSYHSGT